MLNFRYYTNKELKALEGQTVYYKTVGGFIGMAVVRASGAKFFLEGSVCEQYAHTAILCPYTPADAPE